MGQPAPQTSSRPFTRTAKRMSAKQHSTTKQASTRQHISSKQRTSSTHASTRHSAKHTSSTKAVAQKASNKLLVSMRRLWLAAGKRKKALSLVAAVMVAVGIAACFMLSLGNPTGVRSPARAVNQLAMQDPATWTKASIVDHVCNATDWSKSQMVAMLNVAGTMLPSLPPANTTLPGLLPMPPALAKEQPTGGFSVGVPAPPLPFFADAGKRIGHAFPDIYRPLPDDLPADVVPMPYLTPSIIRHEALEIAHTAADAGKRIGHAFPDIYRPLPTDVVPMPYLTPELVKAEAQTDWKYAKLMAPTVADTARQVMGMLPQLSVIPLLAMPTWSMGRAALTQHVAVVSAVMQACWKLAIAQAWTTLKRRPIDIILSIGTYLIPAGKLYKGLLMLVSYAVGTVRGPALPLELVSYEWVQSTLERGLDIGSLLARFPTILRAPGLLTSLGGHRELARNLMFAAVARWGSIEKVMRMWPEFTSTIAEAFPDLLLQR